jgi:hypothetical protein
VCNKLSLELCVLQHFSFLAGFLPSICNVRSTAGLFFLFLSFEKRSFYVTQAGLEFLSSLTQTHECWDYRHEPPQLATAGFSYQVVRFCEHSLLGAQSCWGPCSWSVPISLYGTASPECHRLCVPRMLQLSFFFNFYFIHMCIQCLGHFSPPPPPPFLPSFPPYPSLPGRTILPLSLIMLKREYKQ